MGRSRRTGPRTTGNGQRTGSGAPDFRPLSFEDSVRWFQLWGFQVEPGPRPEQVTLILDGGDHRTYVVHDARMLPEIAAEALGVRWQNGTLTRRAGEANARQGEAAESAWLGVGAGTGCPKDKML